MKPIEQIVKDNKNKKCYLVTEYATGEVEMEKIHSIYVEESKFDMELMYELDEDRGTRYGWWLDGIKIISDIKLELDGGLWIEWEI